MEGTVRDHAERLVGVRRALVAAGAAVVLPVGAALALIALGGAALSASTAGDVGSGLSAVAGLLLLVPGGVLVASAVTATPPRALVARHRRALVLATALALALGLGVLALALAVEPAPLAPVG